MAAPTRYSKVGMAGQNGRANNQTDTWTKTFEIPIVATGQASEVDTGIAIPKTAQTVGGYILVKTPESTGLTKTVSIGRFGGSQTAFADAMAVDATGRYDGLKMNGGVIQNDNLANFSYTEASGDFVELDAVLVIQIFGSDIT